MAEPARTIAQAPAPDSNREPAAEWVPTSALTPWAQNPRKNDHAVAKVADSIRRFGFASPIVARRANGEVIAGHTRLKAAIQLGIDKVPVRFVDLDPADAHLLAVADNKLTEAADWDDALLLDVLSAYSLPDAELAGFDSTELDRLAGDLGAVNELTDDAFGGLPTGDGPGQKVMTVYFTPEQFAVVTEALDRVADRVDHTALHQRGTAVFLVCEGYLRGRSEIDRGEAD
jgi:hypothetical protein